MVAAIAVALLMLSRTVTLIVTALVPEPFVFYVIRLYETLAGPYGVAASGHFFIAFLFGPALALIVNQAFGPEQASTRVIERYGSEREQLLFKAMNDEALVLVSLNSRKCYIGWPVYSPDPRRESRDFRLLPAMSGYRDEQTFELHFTTQYISAYRAISDGTLSSLQATDFYTVIALQDIATLNLFSLAIDQELFDLSRIGWGDNSETG